MKKVFLSLALVFSIGLLKAQTDTVRLQFDYYPDPNVYYNTKAQTYWFIDTATKKWKSGANLPPYYTVDGKSTKNKLFYDGPEVWKNNSKHVKLFGKKTKQ